MTNPSPGLPHPVRRVSPTSPNSAAITSSMLPIPMRRVIPDRRTWSELLRLPRTARRVSRTVQTNAASRPGLYPPARRASPAFPNCPNQCGESPHAPPNSGRESFVSPNFAANCAQNKNSTALTIGNEGIQIQWPSRAHTRKHEAALPPVLMFFYNFFINIILFYYWVTNRDFIDLFCHTPKT